VFNCEIKVWFFVPSAMELGVIEGEVFYSVGGLACVRFEMAGKETYAAVHPDEIHETREDADVSYWRYRSAVSDMVAAASRQSGMDAQDCEIEHLRDVVFV
jgi:hypothetical protein